MTDIVEPVQAALGGRCPRCGEGPLFASFLKFAPRCTRCGLDLSAFNVGDGPVVFLLLGVGGLVTLLAIIVELKFEPAPYVHALLWIPLTTVLVVLMLRFTKAILLALEFKNAAAEGRLKQDP